MLPEEKTGDPTGTMRVWEMPVASHGSSETATGRGAKRVFIVDDHPTLREGLARSIRKLGDLELCGTAANAKDGLAGILESKPDLVTMDISLPDRNGLELVKELLALLPNLPILVFSMHDEKIYAERVIRAGARGYLSKGASSEELVKAIYTVLDDDLYLSATATSRYVKSLAGRGKTSSAFGNLTDRELEVYELIGRGCPIAEIGARLGISPKTADAHRANIKAKLGYTDSVSLMRAAVLWVERGPEPSAEDP